MFPSDSSHEMDETHALVSLSLLCFVELRPLYDVTNLRDLLSSGVLTQIRDDHNATRPEIFKVKSSFKIVLTASTCLKLSQVIFYIWIQHIHEWNVVSVLSFIICEFMYLHESTK